MQPNLQDSTGQYDTKMDPTKHKQDITRLNTLEQLS